MLSLSPPSSLITSRIHGFISVNHQELVMTHEPPFIFERHFRFPYLCRHSILLLPLLGKKLRNHYSSLNGLRCEIIIIVTWSCDQSNLNVCKRKNKTDRMDWIDFRCRDNALDDSKIWLCFTLYITRPY